MVRKIRVIGTPAGLAPRAIRESWVGIEIRMDDAAVRIALGRPGPRPDRSYDDSYAVLAEDAITALEDAGRLEAAAYWDSRAPGGVYCFKKPICQLIEAK